MFADEQTKLDWVKAYKEARGKQGSYSLTHTHSANITVH